MKGHIVTFILSLLGLLTEIFKNKKEKNKANKIKIKNAEQKIKKTYEEIDAMKEEINKEIDRSNTEKIVIDLNSRFKR
jgi:hypothetical protein